MKTETLFQQITQVLPTIPGWCELEKAHALAAAVVGLRPDVVVEVGVFGGKSLLPMALACQAVGRGVVWAVDPWSAAAAVEGYEGANKQWWGSLNHEEIHQGFLRRVRELGVGEQVVVHRAKSDDVTPPEVIDILHIDGQHTDQAVRDANRFGRRVRVGGLCFVDDVEWVNETTGYGVKRGVAALRALGFAELYPVGTGACFQRWRQTG